MNKAKKFLSTALALILILSLSVSSFAAVNIDYVFTAEIDGDEYTVLMGSTDLSDEFDEIGVTVNGTDYKIEDSKLSHAQTTKRFGIAFKNAGDNLVAATPYMLNEGEKTVGEEVAIDKNATMPDVINKEITPAIEILDTDDRGQTTGNELKQQRLWVDGVTTGYNWINFLKIDVSGLDTEKIDLTRNISLSVYAAMQIPKGNTSFMTIRSFMMPASFDWEAEKAIRVDGSNYNFSKKGSASEGEDYEAYVNGKTPISTEVKELDNKNYSWFDINITPAVYHAIKNNEKYAYVILAPDCRNINSGCSAVFRYYTEGNEKYAYAPKLKYYEVDTLPSNSDVSEIMVGTKKLTKADFADGAYTYYARTGEVLPEVTATAEVEGAQVIVNQATAEANYATVNIVSANGKNTSTYTVKYEAPTNTVQFFDGLVVKGFSNKLLAKTEEDKVNYDDFYYYDITDSGRKNHAGNVVAVNTADIYKISDSTGSSKAGSVLLELDLSKLAYVDTTKPIMMNIYHSRDDAGANNNVQLYDVTSANIDWANLTTEYLRTTLYDNYISGKTPVATEMAFINGSYTENGYTESTAEYTFKNPGCNVLDITNFVKTCLDNNITNPVLAVYLEKEGFFRFSYNTSTTSFVSYYQDKSYLSNAEIKEAAIGTEKITKADFVDGVYNYYIRTGEAYPVVEATSAIAGAQVTVTQATAETKSAVINIVSENGANSATYTINFVEPTKTVQFFNDFVINGFSNMLASGTEGKVNTEDYYYYNKGMTEQNKKNNAHGIVLNTSNETAEFGSSGTTYNAPVLLQLDLEMLANDYIDTSKPVYMNIYYSRYDGGINNRIQLFDVSTDVASQVTADGEVDWTKLSTTYLKTLLTGKTAFATAKGFINGSFDAAGKYTESTEAYNNKTAGSHVIDITDFVKNCIDNNNLAPVVAVQLRDEGYTRFTYTNNEKADMPFSSFVSYYQDDSYLSNAEIKGAAIGAEEITKADFVDGVYNYYVKAGEAYPVVEATPAIPGAQVTVTQATEETKCAVVNVVSKNGENTASYTINFVEFNYAETVTPAISYIGSNSACDKSSKDAYQFSIGIYENGVTANFLKIDLSSLKGKEYINKNTKFTLNLNAKMMVSKSDSALAAKPENMTVKVVTLPETFDWATEEVNADRAASASSVDGAGEGSDYKTYIDGKTPVTTGSLAFTEAFESLSLDITSVIYNALAANEDYAYIALAGDIAQKDEFENAKSIVCYYYIAGKNAPTVTLDTYVVNE